MRETEAHRPHRDLGSLRDPTQWPAWVAEGKNSPSSSLSLKESAPNTGSTTLMGSGGLRRAEPPQKGLTKGCGTSTSGPSASCRRRKDSRSSRSFVFFSMIAGRKKTGSGGQGLRPPAQAALIITEGGMGVCAGCWLPPGHGPWVWEILTS